MLLQELFEPNQIAWLVRRLARSMNMSPIQINNGWCGAFAWKLQQRLGVDARKVNTSHYYSDGGVFPGHAVVFYHGRFYDAENPEGVQHPSELAYCKRMIRIRDGLEDFPPELFDD